MVQVRSGAEEAFRRLTAGLPGHAVGRVVPTGGEARLRIAVAGAPAVDLPVTALRQAFGAAAPDEEVRP